MRWYPKDGFLKLRPHDWFAWRPVVINIGDGAGTVVWLETVIRWEEHSMRGAFWFYQLKESSDAKKVRSDQR